LEDSYSGRRDSWDGKLSRNEGKHMRLSRLPEVNRLFGPSY
jgi:hypothetical protein